MNCTDLRVFLRAKGKIMSIWLWSLCIFLLARARHYVKLQPPIVINTTKWTKFIPFWLMFFNFFMRSIKVKTPAAFDFWCYIIITWHPEKGLQFYGNSNLKTSLHAGEANSAPPPVYNGKLNFVVGRGLNQKPEQMCGVLYMSSTAVFKQYVNQEWVKKIFAFFWKNSKLNWFFMEPLWKIGFMFLKLKTIGLRNILTSSWKL